MIRVKHSLLLSFSLLVQASAFASGIGTRGGAPPVSDPLRWFTTSEAKSIVDALTTAVPSQQDEWTLTNLTCSRSLMEIVGGPNGAPFSIREINSCQFEQNGEKTVLEKCKAKALFAALDVEWVRARTGNQYKELKLSTLTCKRQVDDEANLISSCVGRK